MTFHNNIHIKDGFTTSDKSTSDFSSQPLMKGIVECVDNKTGKVLFRKPNIITQKGKVFMLEKLTGEIEVNSGIPQSDLPHRKLCAFQIGNGGINPDNTIISVKPSSYSDTALFNQLVFYDEQAQYKNGDVYKEGVDNASYYVEYKEPSEKISIFESEHENDEGWNSIYKGNLRDYKLIKGVREDLYESLINSEVKNNNWAVFTVQESNNTQYVKIKLTISVTDLDAYNDFDRKFNELGLIVGTVVPELEYKTDEGGNEIFDDNGEKIVKDMKTYIKDPILFSHITFDDIYLNEMQNVTFYYYIYCL